MAISKKSIELLTSMGFNIDELVNAVKDSKEVDITTPSGKFYTDDQIVELKANVKKGHEEAYPEILGKQLNEKYELGLSTTDAKNLEKLTAALMKKGEEYAKVEPSKKVAELEASIKKLQEETIPMKEKEASEWRSKYQEREEFERYARLIPKDANPYLTKEEHIARIKKHVKINEDGTAIDPTTGNTYKDNLEKPLKYDAVVADLYKKNEGWIVKTEQEKKPFHHSTNAPSGRKAGDFDHDKAMEAVKAMYPEQTMEATMMRQKEMTRLMTEHASANVV